MVGLRIDWRQWMRRSQLTVATLAGVLMLMTGCVVGPDYVRPTVIAPAAYKEIDGWKVAQPQDDAIRGAWWEVFGDPQLNALEAHVSLSNQNLAVAEATYQQARALVREARASYFPTLTLGLGYTRFRDSETFGKSAGGRSSAGTSSSGASSAGASSAGAFVGGGSGNTLSNFQLGLDFSWELDLWGRIRRTVESEQASAQASAGDLESARLSFQAELAQDYFLLRTLDAQKRLLNETVAAYEKSLEITKNQYASGVASQADVVQAETQLKTTQAQAIDVGVQRAQTEHAIAMLIGQPASNFSLPAAPLTATPPPIPIGVPAELLERRPDIAAAERRVAEANAQIGVAEAAYYPTLTLSASSGLESSSLSQWLTAPSRFWAVGPSISETVFDGGLRRAQTDFARAGYDASVGTYRQTVLTAFQGVEDNLAALRILDQEAQVQDEAVRDAQQSVTLTTNQYKAGTASYLNVITAQTIALTDETTAVQIRGRRMSAAVLLIQALGGGWNASALPSAQEVTTREMPAALK
jgi:NodT family efflux transporter outer membrane factor (OMF) lipoprotein